MTTTTPLFDFTDSRAAAAWRGVHDGVMGGLSSGSVVPCTGKSDGAAAFEGELSLANGGGFASVRASVAPSATAGTTALRLLVRGDGRRYQVTAKEPPLDDVGLWRCELEVPAGVWTRVTVPWAKFVRSLHGRADPSVPPPEPGRIAQIGFLVADGRPGPFRLEIARIAAVGG